MKKLFLIPALFLCLCVGLPGLAGASGYSMAVISQDYNVVVLAKFSDTDFSEMQAKTYSQFLGGMISSYIDNAVFLDNPGDPDDLRTALQDFTNTWEIIFVQISKGESPVPAQGPNIWLDIWYDNDDMYVASFGFSEIFAQMIN